MRAVAIEIRPVFGYSDLEQWVDARNEVFPDDPHTAEMIALVRASELEQVDLPPTRMAIARRLRRRRSRLAAGHRAHDARRPARPGARHVRGRKGHEHAGSVYGADIGFEPRSATIGFRGPLL
jgi:hypothetical protein